jgi:Na+-translocating ferredoxin:NAD+ oxidoreductase RnfE subunit
MTSVFRREVNDDLSIPAVTLILRNGETKKILLAGYGHSLYEHLSSRYPQIAISYIPSSPSMG